MKRNRAAYCITSALALCACATPEPPWLAHKTFAEATPLCSLLENPKPYAGKRVLVRGYLMSTPHGREFFDTGCEDGSILLNFNRSNPSPVTARGRRMRLVYDAYVAQFIDRPPFVSVVYSGIFTDHRPANIGFGPFSLEQAEMVAVRRLNVRKRPRRTRQGAPGAVTVK